MANYRVVVLAVGLASILLFCLVFLWALGRASGLVEILDDRLRLETPVQGGGGSLPRLETILVVGLDGGMRKAGEDPGRTAFPDIALPDVRGRNDVVLLVALDRHEHMVRLLSIPRDTLVFLPGYAEQKIAHTMAYFPYWQLETVVEDLLDLEVDHYAVLDFQGFRDLIDAIGGVDVTVDHDLRSAEGGFWLTAGPHHLDGGQALELVRHRYGEPEADISRIRLQRSFLVDLARRLGSGGLVPALGAITDNPGMLKTDLSVGELLALFNEWKDYNPANADHELMPGWPEGAAWRLDPAGVVSTADWFKGVRGLLAPR